MGESAGGGSNPGFQVEDVIEVLERRRAWILLAALAGLFVGLVLTVVLPPRYTSKTLILVEAQEVPADYVRSTVSLDVQQRVQTLQHRVTGQANLNHLIEQVGAERLDPGGKLGREALLAEIRNNLVVEVEQSRGEMPASIFEVAYTGVEPAVVKDVAEAIANLFISENIKEREQQATETANFLDRELARLRQDVAEHEEKIRGFREARMGSLPTQLETNLQGLDRMNLQLAANLEAQEGVAARLALLQRQLADTGTGPTGVGPTDLVTALGHARAALLQAQSIYTDEHPNVKHLRGEVERLEREIDAAPAGLAQAPVARNPAALAVQQELEAARIELNNRKRQEQSLREGLVELERRVEETPRREQELQDLTRDYADLQETYRSLLGKKYEAVIARNLEQAQKGERFKVLRPAQVSESPSWPDPMVLLPAGLGVALALAGLGIAFMEFRNPAFRSVARLTRALDLPVVASIPRIDNDRIYEQPPTGDVDPRLVVHTAPESAPAEQYRGFLPAFLEAENCQVILVTSAARGDGKSLTCMNLAATVAADLNRRVLVIDGDLRRPTAHRLLRLSRATGLSDILRSNARLADCAVNSKIKNLSVLPAGPSLRNPVAFLTSRAFLDLLSEARDRYDVVFIDSPPLLPVVDTRILRKMADMVLFVVRADATPREAVVRSLQDLRDVTGVVFNEVSPGSFRRYYYYDAYSRYAYGDPVAEGAEPGARGA